MRTIITFLALTGSFNLSAANWQLEVNLPTNEIKTYKVPTDYMEVKFPEIRCGITKEANSEGIASKVMSCYSKGVWVQIVSACSAEQKHYFANVQIDTDKKMGSAYLFSLSCSFN